MPKRGENIRKRKDGRWEGRYKRQTMLNGKTQYGSVYGKTYKEVKEKLKERQSIPTEASINFVEKTLGDKYLKNGLIIKPTTEDGKRKLKIEMYKK